MIEYEKGESYPNQTAAKLYQIVVMGKARSFEIRRDRVYHANEDQATYSNMINKKKLFS